MDIQDIAAPHRPKAGNLRLLNRAGVLKTLDPNGVEKAVGLSLDAGGKIPAALMPVTVLPESPFGLSPLRTIGAVGDSITDRSTSVSNAYATILMEMSGWAAVLETLSNRRIKSVGFSSPDSIKTTMDRDMGYSGILAHAYATGLYPSGLETFTPHMVPLDRAVAMAPDCYCVHIGTNDVDEYMNPVTIAGKVIAVWAGLVATGKPVIGTDILQRSASYSGWNATKRDVVTATNAILRSAWQSAGLAAYRMWDDLLPKDTNGYANPAYLALDGIHPTMRLGVILGKDIHALLMPYYGGLNLSVPDDGDASWVTPNPYVSGSIGSYGESGLATNWAVNSIQGATFSKVVDAQGVWQRITLGAPVAWGEYASAWCRNTNSSSWAAGTKYRATARIRILPGSGIAGVSLLVYTGASEAFCAAIRDGHNNLSAPVDGFEATYYSDVFTMPAGCTSCWLMVVPSGGNGSFDFQKAGIIKA